MTVPHTADTEGMLGRQQFALMKPTAVFINIGRGQTVVLDDLVDALEAGQLAGAGLDVFDEEPPPSPEITIDTTRPLEDCLDQLPAALPLSQA